MWLERGSRAAVCGARRFVAAECRYAAAMSAANAFPRRFQ
jgi:hypothetical protein